MSALHRVALWVRRATWTVAAATMVVAVAVAMFDAGRHSAGDRELTVAPSTDTDLVTQVVAEVEAQGLACSSTPSLAASIVFEHLDGTVEVVSFDAALGGARAGSGWVRWYCTPPVGSSEQFTGPA